MRVAVRRRHAQEPEPTDELTAAWDALAERERRSQEVMRRRLQDFEERSARLNALTEELEQRLERAAAAEAELEDARRALGSREAALVQRERLVQEGEGRIEGNEARATEL